MRQIYAYHKHTKLRSVIRQPHKCIFVANVQTSQILLLFCLKATIKCFSTGLETSDPLWFFTQPSDTVTQGQVPTSTRYSNCDYEEDCNDICEDDDIQNIYCWVLISLNATLLATWIFRNNTTWPLLEPYAESKSPSRWALLRVVSKLLLQRWYYKQLTQPTQTNTTYIIQPNSHNLKQLTSLTQLNKTQCNKWNSRNYQSLKMSQDVLFVAISVFE